MKFLKSQGYVFIFLILLCTASFAGSLNSAGRVIEVIEVPGYIYLHLEEPDIWIATRPIEINTGDEITYTGGSEMRNFYSNTLQKTFNSIIFVKNVKLSDPSATASQISTVTPESHAGYTSKKPQASSIEPPAADEITPLNNGHTITNILNNSSSLAGKNIKLRAKVMKFNSNIMGKNWVTLQDGSGPGSEKIIATSIEVVNPGDIVVVSGKLVTNINLGSGYVYKTLLEHSSFTLEER